MSCQKVTPEMFTLSQAGQKASSGQGYFPDWVEEYVLTVWIHFHLEV